MSISKTIGFIGLGNMGAPLASRIGSHVKNLRVYDVDPKSIERFSQQYPSIPFTTCEKIEDVVKNCDLLMTCVRHSGDVTDIYNQITERDFIWIDLTSGNPYVTQELSEKLLRRNISLIDCGVSGGPKGAAEGTLTAMIGGDKKIVDTVYPIFETFAKQIYYLGPSGSGHATKAANNFLLGHNMNGAFEVYAVLKAFGVITKTALEAISNSSGQSKVTKQRIPEFILKGKDYGFSIDLLEKDIRIYDEMRKKHGSKELNLPAPILFAIDMAKLQHNAEDHLDLIKVFLPSKL